MDNKKVLIGVLAAVVLAGILFLVFSNRDDQSQNGLNNSPASQDLQNAGTDTQAVTPNGTNDTTAGQQNSVVLGEVEGGNIITVSQATLTKPGYVVLYRVNSNGEGAVAANSELLSVGTHSNVQIQLDSPAVERQAIVAVLHEDDGDETFEYPESDMYLVNADAQVVNDIDVVGVSRTDQESKILEAQIRTFIENNF